MAAQERLASIGAAEDGVGDEEGARKKRTRIAEIPPLRPPANKGPHHERWERQHSPPPPPLANPFMCVCWPPAVLAVPISVAANPGTASCARRRTGAIGENWMSQLAAAAAAAPDQRQQQAGLQPLGAGAPPPGTSVNELMLQLGLPSWQLSQQQPALMAQHSRPLLPAPGLPSLGLPTLPSPLFSLPLLPSLSALQMVLGGADGAAPLPVQHTAVAAPSAAAVLAGLAGHLGPTPAAPAADLGGATLNSNNYDFLLDLDMQLEQLDEWMGLVDGPQHPLKDAITGAGNPEHAAAALLGDGSAAAPLAVPPSADAGSTQLLDTAAGGAAPALDAPSAGNADSSAPAAAAASSAARACTTCSRSSSTS